jgi:uncharacterized MnhB-related membrane protein
MSLSRFEIGALVIARLSIVALFGFCATLLGCIDVEITQAIRTTALGRVVFETTLETHGKTADADVSALQDVS